MSKAGAGCNVEGHGARWGKTLEPADLAALFPLGLIAACIGASIVYRRRSGKPVFPRAPDDAVFVERTGRHHGRRRSGADSTEA